MAVDRYRWLEDPTDPATVRWEAERAVGYERAAAAWRRRGRFAERLRTLYAVDAPVSAPRQAGGRLFYARLATGAEHPVLAVDEGTGEPRVLVDPARLDPTGLTTVEAWEPSPDGRLLSYQLATGGTEQASLHVVDVATGDLVDGPIDRIRNTSVAWLPDGKAFYYVRRLPGEDRYHRRVYLHRIGVPADEDVLVFGAGRERTQHYSLSVDPDGRWLVVSAAAGTSPRREVWLADLATGDPECLTFTPVQVGLDARTSLRVRSTTGYVLTDLDAPRRRLAVTPVRSPEPGTWIDLIPEDASAVLSDYVILDDPRLPRPQLLVAWTRHAVAELTVHDLTTGERTAVLPIPPCGSVGVLRAAARGAAAAWFVHSGFTTVPVVLRYDAFTGLIEPWHPPGVQPAPAGGAAPVDTRQVVFTSRDGTPVRMFVLTPGGLDDGRPDRPRPTILTAYGGFGQSMSPVYSPEAVAWVAAGGVYAVANVRGGGEEGQGWHRAGMLANKVNTFDDFAAAADHLVAGGWTTVDRLGIWGSSNGGLVIGAAVTRQPQAYAAAAMVAPLLDMARYERSGLGPSWVGEYGTASDPEQLAWLLSYSPYHHVRAGRTYPAVLFMVFDGDSRVDPLHARKMCAALRATGAEPLYRLERGVGHGLRSTSSRVDLMTDLLAFFADQLGID